MPSVNGLCSAIFNAVSDNLILLKVKKDSYKISQVNNAFLKNTPFTKEQVEGKDVRQVLSKNSLPLLLSKYEEAIQTKKAVVFTVASRLNNKKHLFENEVTPLFDKNTCTHLLIASRDITHQKKLQEKVEKLTRKHRLTQKEQEIFTGVIKFPMLTDGQLAESLSLKRSTVTAVRNRLLKNKYYKVHYLPNYGALSCEIITFVYGYIPSKKDFVKKLFSFSEVIYGVRTQKAFVVMIVSQNYTALQEIINFIYTQAQEGKTPYIEHFPFSLTSLSKFFSYNSLVCSLFGKQVTFSPTFSSNRTLSLDYDHQIVLYALTKYNLPDYEIAKKLGISRQKVSKLKKFFIENGILKLCVIPNIKKLGFELFVYSSLALERDKVFSVLKGVPGSTLLLSSDRTSSSFLVCKNYSKYKEQFAFLTSIAQKKKDPPFIRLFPIEDIKEEYINFASLLQKNFELDVEF